MVGDEAVPADDNANQVALLFQLATALHEQLLAQLRLHQAELTVKAMQAKIDSSTQLRDYAKTLEASVALDVAQLRDAALTRICFVQQKSQIYALRSQVGSRWEYPHF